VATRPPKKSRGARPDPKRVAAEVLEEAGANGSAPVSEPIAEDAPRRGRGRPPGAKSRTKVVAREPYVATDEGVQLAGMLGATIWSLVGPIARLRPLDEQETEKLGRALDPLMWKYLPVLGDWQIEFNAAIVILALVQATRGKGTEYHVRVGGNADAGDDGEAVAVEGASGNGGGSRRSDDPEPRSLGTSVGE
jgi:hypothetical protein